MSECAFCDIVDGLTSTRLLYDTSAVVIFPPLNPVITGHLLVVPKKHVADFSTNPFVSAEVMHAASCWVTRAGYRGDYNLITSKGSAATQTVFHMHVHLVPRFSGDGLRLPWTGQKK